LHSLLSFFESAESQTGVAGLIGNGITDGLLVDLKSSFEKVRQ